MQAHAFADPKPFSRGFHGAVTNRRAMPLVNVRYMQGIVARGDTNADAALDSSEILALVQTPSCGPTRVSLRPQVSEGLPGVLRDLKLSPAKHLRALVIVGAHKPPRSANDPAIGAVLREMKALLAHEEYGNFLAAATRLSRIPDIGPALSGESSAVCRLRDPGKTRSLHPTSSIA